jgi:4-hydroxy-4-methyl-2-oxoglutarate aldolase
MIFVRTSRAAGGRWYESPRRCGEELAQLHISGTFPRPSEDVVARFGRLGVADVGEAMDGHNLMQLIAVVSGARVAGPATTFLTPPGQNLALQVAVEVARPGDVVVGSGLGSPTALWGMTVTVAARARGIAGAVVDGCARDIADIRNEQFPVWCASVSARGARKDVFGAVNVATVCAGVLVRPGDVVLADDDGVIVVPLEDAEEILTRAEERRGQEEEMVPRLRSGATPFQLLGLSELLAGKGVTIDGSESRQPS